MRYIFSLLFILLIFEGNSQLIINQTGTVAQWVQNTLVGNGITVSNVSYTGSLQSIGTFSSGANSGNMGITSGLVLSTGKVNQLPGLGSAFCSTNTNGGSDPQLASLITQSINDAAVLQFDFVPVSDTIKFRYVFGSEEYPEFVNSINDVFGFFVSGLNPFGGAYNNTNIALIPGTTTPITINNVNASSNSNYYVNNAFGTYVKLDGFTTVLTAWVRVIPCVTYHIKIAIGDAQDHIYDSGVFLEANSFMSNAIIIKKSTTSIIDTTAVEGCNDAIITFKIPNPRPVPTIINYFAGGTATNGVDYTQLPSHVTIPAGQDSINLIIHPILDNIAEPTEYINLIVSTSVCTYDTVLIAIKDNSPPVPSLPNDTVICGSGVVNLTANTSGGYSPYSYLWSNGDTSSSIFVSPNITTTYTLSVTDLCMNDSIDSSIVIVSRPFYQIKNDTVCYGDTALISVQDSMNNSYLWAINSSTNNYINTIPTSDNYYSFTTTDTMGCSIIDSAFVKVNPLPQALTSSDTIICNGGNAILRAYGNYNFLWSNGVSQPINIVSPNTDSVFEVVISDSNLCKTYSQINVAVVSIPIAEIESPSDSICIGNTTSLSAKGGDEYQWNNGSIFQDIYVTPMKTFTYIVTVTNTNANTRCSDIASFKLNVKRCNFFYFPNAFTPNGDGLNDKFGVVGEYGAIDYFKLYVYNRWGNIVFYTDNPFKNWDGIYKGQNAPDGVYTYIAIIKEKNFDQYEIKGTIHLIR